MNLIGVLIILITMAEVRRGHHIEKRLTFLQSDQVLEAPDTVYNKREVGIEEEPRIQPLQFSSRKKRIIPPDWLKSLPFAKSCGRRSNLTGLIIKGYDTKKGEYPWLVAMYHFEGNETNFKCGASLISHTHVITAAHCTTRQERVLLQFGRYDIGLPFEQNGEIRLSSNIIRDPDYRGEAQGDVALISFDYINFTPWIIPICLRTNYDDSIPGIIAGWGQPSNDEQVNTNTPLKLNVSIVELEMCRESDKQLAGIATDKTFCAGGEKSGPCHGDSGGGFYINYKNVWYLRGIVSHSLGDEKRCNVEEYAVYADIKHSLYWIRPHLTNALTPATPSAADVTTPPPQPYDASWVKALPDAGTCGKSSQFEYPWIVAIYHSNVYKCGGTLISNAYVITAAQCVDKQSQVNLLLGKPNISNPNKEDFIERSSDYITIHPEYNGAAHADIALINIGYVEFTDMIKPICLWTVSDTNYWSGMVAGWGISGGDGFNEMSKDFDVHLKPNTCKKSHVAYESLLTNQTFCGGGRGIRGSLGGVRLCHGYVGSGFYTRRKNVAYLRGILSRALGNEHICNEDFNSVYVDLRYYLDWLRPYLSSEPLRPNNATWLMELPDAETCGRTMHPEPIFDGKADITEGQYPWMVAIFHSDYKEESFMYMCGGTLISNKYVITAEQCVERQLQLYLLLGKQNISTPNKEDFIVRSADYYRSYYPPDFRSDIQGDICLIDIGHVEFTQMIKPICLWANFDSKLRKGIVAGWGNSGGDGIDQISKQFSVNMKSPQTCKKADADLEPVNLDKTFCGVGQVQVARLCYGYTGSGFYIRHGDVWYLRGVVSKYKLPALKCNIDFHSIYIDLQYYWDWMRSYLLP